MTRRPPAVFALFGRLPWLLPAAVCALGCALPAPADEPPPPQTGVASWHEGTTRTASGRRWRSEDLIAAHPTLPLGSYVKVINLANGRETVVLITDRGPFTRGRIIDLSAAAARQIDCLDAGTANVRLEVVQLARFTRIDSASPDPRPSPPR